MLNLKHNKVYHCIQKRNFQQSSINYIILTLDMDKVYLKNYKK